MPDTVAEHPAVFVTLTAPSFGAVHSRALGPDGQPRRCRPRRDAPVCPHGVSLSCRAVHGEGDPCLGEPLCRECFDYAGAVMWNNTLGELWRYTTIYVPRALARLAGMTQARAQAPGARRVREGRRVPAARPGAPARARPAGSRDARVPRRADPPARAALRRAAARASDPRGRRRRLRAGRRPSWAAAACAGATSSTSATSTRATRAARSPATWPSTRPRAPNRPAGCCIASTPTRSTRARARARPQLHARRVRARRDRQATRAAPDLPRRRPRSTSRPTGTRPRSPSALRRAMSTRRARCACACTTTRAHRPRRAAARRDG